MLKSFIASMALVGSVAAGQVEDVAWTLWAEARGESFRGKCAVASVIVTRAQERKLSLVQVCKQRKQFSCWNSGGPKEYPWGNKMWEQCLLISRDMHRGTFKRMGTWNHYYNPRLACPSWGNKMSNIKHVGNHKFGRL